MNSPESFNFGRKIKDLKRAYNKTYADLTSGLKISRERIIQLEENEREPTDLERRRFAEYYALPVEEFGPFGGGAMPSPAPRPYGNPPAPGNTFDSPRPGPAYPPTNYSNDRPPREGYINERPTNYGNDRPPRDNYGNERPPMYNNRGNYGDRGNYGNDRPPRENYGNERPPRENYGNERPPYDNNRGNYNERPPRDNYGNERPPRDNYGNERPPYDNNRGNYNNRGDNMGNLRTPPSNRPPGNFTPRPQGNFQAPRPPMGNGRPPVDEERPAAPKPAPKPAARKPASNGDSKEPKPVMKYTAEQLGDIESAYLRKQRDLKVPLKFTFLNGKEYTGVVVDFTPFTVHIIEQDTNEEVILRKLAMAYYRKADALEEAQAAQAQGGGASEEV